MPFQFRSLVAPITTVITVASLVTLVDGCLAEPRFELSDRKTGVNGATPAGADDDAMVLVPAASFVAPGTLAPVAPGRGDDERDDEKEKGKGNGNGEGDEGGGGDGAGGGEPAPEGGEPAPGGGSMITVPAFWIDAREVSAAAYASCVLAGACADPPSDVGCTIAADLGSHPANCVTVDQARAFCVWRGKRLVRNDEWTAASAGSALRPYPWGAEPPAVDRLNACGAECGSPSMYPEADEHVQTAPRGMFPLGRTPDGVYDLAGNVAEWTDLSGTTVVRGGSFADADPASVSSLGIRAVSGGAPSIAIGFRCAKDA